MCVGLAHGSQLRAQICLSGCTVPVNWKSLSPASPHKNASQLGFFTFFSLAYFNWKRRGFFMALLVTVIWHFISYRIYHPHGKRKNFCKGRVEKLRANIAYSLLPWRTSQNLQVRRVKRKDLSFDVRVTLRKLQSDNVLAHLTDCWCHQGSRLKGIHGFAYPGA